MDERTGSLAIKKWYFNIVPRLGSFWIGAHLSYRNKALCVALVPCLVFRIGRTPYRPDEKD